MPQFPQLQRGRQQVPAPRVMWGSLREQRLSLLPRRRSLDGEVLVHQGTLLHARTCRRHAATAVRCARHGPQLDSGSPGPALLGSCSWSAHRGRGALEGLLPAALSWLCCGGVASLAPGCPQPRVGLCVGLPGTVPGAGERGPDPQPRCCNGAPGTGPSQQSERLDPVWLVLSCP